MNSSKSLSRISQYLEWARHMPGCAANLQLDEICDCGLWELRSNAEDAQVQASLDAAAVHLPDNLQRREISDTEEAEEPCGWKPTILQLRNLYHKHTQMKRDPLAEDTLEMWVFGWAIKQLQKRTHKPVSVNLALCANAMQNIPSSLDESTTELWRRRAKAVLDAAGIKYE